MDKRFVIPGLYYLESESTNFVTATPDDFTLNGSRILTEANPGPPAQTITLAAIGSTPNANAASLNSGVLNLQPANGSFGGVVTTAAQTFAGLKTFTNGISAPGVIAGLSAIGNSPNANGASVSGSNLSLQPASVSFGGVVTTSAQEFNGLKTFNDGIFSNLVFQNGNVAMTLDAGTITAQNPVDYSGEIVSYRILLSINMGAFGLITAVTGGTPTTLYPTGGVALPTAYWPGFATAQIIPFINNNLETSAVLYISVDGIISIKLLNGGNLVTPFGWLYTIMVTMFISS